MMQPVYGNYAWKSPNRSSSIIELPSVQTRHRSNGCCGMMDWRSFGIILSLVSAASLALGVADVVLTYQTYIVNRDCPSKTSEPPCDPNVLVFTWVAVGIWASLPVFVLGIVAIRLGRRQAPERSSWFEILAFLCTFLFAPAMVALSVVEIYKGVNVYYWKAYNGAADDLAKAIIPIVIGSLGLLELLMSLIAFIAVCCCSIPYSASYISERPDTVSRTFLQARKVGCSNCQSNFPPRSQIYPANQGQGVDYNSGSRAIFQPTTGFSAHPTTYNYFNNVRPVHNHAPNNFRW